MQELLDAHGDLRGKPTKWLRELRFLVGWVKSPPASKAGKARPGAADAAAIPANNTVPPAAAKQSDMEAEGGSASQQSDRSDDEAGDEAEPIEVVKGGNKAVKGGVRSRADGARGPKFMTVDGSEDGTPLEDLPRDQLQVSHLNRAVFLVYVRVT